MFIDNTTLNLTVQLNIGTFSVTNSTLLVVLPHVITKIGNYSQNYTIRANEGLLLYPTFTYSECPTNPGPVNVPSNISIGCNLYDVNNNQLKPLP